MWYTFCIHFVYFSCIHLVQFFYTKCIHSFRVGKECKTFTFFVDCSIVDAKLVFVPRYSVASDALIEIGVPLYLDTKL